MPLAWAASRPVGDLNAEVEKFRDGDGLAGDAMLEGLAFEQFHGDEGAAFEFVDVVNGADVGMVQEGGGAGFAAESFDGLWVMGDVVGKKFEGDVAAETGVFGLVDHTHPSAAEFFLDGIVGDGAAGE